MYKKILVLSLLFFLGHIIKAQDEFITIWQPNRPNTIPLIDVNAPNPAGTDQIWFPGIGENYTISWEEINYPQHNGTMNNVTSTKQILINFGTSLNPNPVDATYRVKVTNGNGFFKQIKFGECQMIPLPEGYFLMWDVFGSADKITEIAQWGNIGWISMNSAFTFCRRIQLTATDTPNLNNVTDASLMFYNCQNFLGAPSMLNWNTSTIKDFSWMFAYNNDYTQAIDNFNFPLGNWNMSSAENIRYMFTPRKKFNQNLNNWNTSNVTDMSWTFAACASFNQPLDKWDTSKVTDMSFIFHFIPLFNQPLANWNTSNVINMGHIFHGCTAFNQPLNTWNISKVTTTTMMFCGATHFNQPLDTWDTSKVTDMSIMFASATNFNQSLENWNLNLLNNAENMLTGSGLNCDTYSKTISGWANNSNTPSNINLGPLAPLQYSVDAIPQRNLLINNGWTLNGDTVGSCRTLGVSEHNVDSNSFIYPNPAENDLYLKHMHNVKNYKILDVSGRVIIEASGSTNLINISSLAKGNYILQIISNEKIQSFKFIKK